jgi:aminoglycoside 6'-N-acetyltransferase I
MIKRCTLLDHTGWLPLRLALWPGCDTDNEQEKQNLLGAPERYLVLTFTDDSSEALGFVETERVVYFLKPLGLSRP